MIFYNITERGTLPTIHFRISLNRWSIISNGKRIRYTTLHTVWITETIVIFRTFPDVNAFHTKHDKSSQNFVKISSGSVKVMYKILRSDCCETPCIFDCKINSDPSFQLKNCIFRCALSRDAILTRLGVEQLLLQTIWYFRLQAASHSAQSSTNKICISESASSKHFSELA